MTMPSARDGRLRIVVSGFLGLLPAGGVTWDYVQYPAGFRALGHDVYYVEDTGLWPVYATDSATNQLCDAGVANLRATMHAFELGDRWAYRDEVTGEWFGMTASRAAEVIRTADVFVNVSCSGVLRDAHTEVAVRVLVDSDPMFTQMQYAAERGFTPGASTMRALVDAHTHHFTFAL